MMFLKDRTLLFESRVNEIETELSAFLAKEKPLPISREWWLNKTMRYLMANQKLRDQIFHFIEAFPELTSPADVHRHILEDLAPDNVSLPEFLRSVYGIGYGLAKKLGPNRFSAKFAELAVRAVARRFIVSRNPKHIFRVLSELRGQGAGYSIDILGEAVVSEQEAERYALVYKKLVRELNLLATEVDVSLKLSSLYSQFHPLAGEDAKRIVKERLGGILWYCWGHGGGVTIDMEQYQFRDLTLEIFKELTAGEFAEWKWGLGIAHQTYLKDSGDILSSLCRFAQRNMLYFKVRLVKGAYWDFEIINARQNNWPVPVYTERQDTDRSFERNVNIALGHYPWIRAAVGTHSLRSIAYAMTKTEELGLPKEALEVQVLYGLGTPLVKPVRKLGYPVRVYIGLGDLAQGISFLARRLLENTSQASSAFFSLRT